MKYFHRFCDWLEYKAALRKQRKERRKLLRSTKLICKYRTRG